jgi:glycosyltransferase involved in cell wall biosynthesis
MTISVIIPTYNRASLVTATLDSVLAQTRPADEIWVVDDGSTDDTQAIVTAYADVHGNRVRYQRQKNAGPSVARNHGMRLTTGTSLCFLDSDDLLDPRALELLAEALETELSAMLAYSRAEMLSPDGNALGLWEPGGGYHQGDVWESLLGDNFIRSPGATLIRRTALEAVGSWDEAMRKNEDWNLWLRLAEQGPFVFVDEPLFRYRVHPSAASVDVGAMHHETMRMYGTLRKRYQSDPKRLQTLKRIVREVQYAEPLYLLALARVDLRQGRPMAGCWKAVRALARQPSFLFDPRLKRQLTQEWGQKKP